MNRITILCVGNYLMGDEGVGIHAARILERTPLQDGIKVVDGGSGGLKLLSLLDTDEKIILVDAALDNTPPGTIRLLRPKLISDFPRALSTHEIGLHALLESMVLMERMPDIYLFAVSIENPTSLSIELSTPIKTCLPQLIDKIIELCDQLVNEPILE